MTDYSKMSDFEINRAVGEILLSGKWSCKPGTGGNDTESWYYGSVDTFVTPYAELPDYCKSWADAGPIIQSNRLYVDPIFISDWCVTTECDTYRVIHKNPLRAAMIAFLMMNEGE